MGVVNVVRNASSGASRRKGGLPLALVIVRYFAYVLVMVGLLLAGLFVVFSLLVSSGAAYPASYADENVSSVTESLASGERELADIPSCYRWAVFDGGGAVVASDMDPKDVAPVWDAAKQGLTSVRYSDIGVMCMQATVSLPSGDLCALQYDYLPDFTSKSLRDALPDPQTLLILAFFVLFALFVALIAMRAAHVISRKMQPLADAALRIEQQDLDFEVGFTNVREVNDVLTAMERMRSALAESLRARWAADDAQRRQVSALAHDLKTPLAIARWNADMLGEATQDGEQEACAEGLSESIERMEAYVHLLVEASRTGACKEAMDNVAVAQLAEEVRRQASSLCVVRGHVLDFSCACVGHVRGDEAQLVRAVVNLVANAVEQTPEGSTVVLRVDGIDGVMRVAVEDEGPGFSVEALACGTDRFYTSREDRNAVCGHYGLGLAIVNDIVRVHGGTLELSNKEGSGARCVICVPLI